MGDFRSDRDQAQEARSRSGGPMATDTQRITWRDWADAILSMAAILAMFWAGMCAGYVIW
jgi:hypothetical protein